MELFEFLMILVSVIIGLALGELFSGAATLIRERQSVRFHWLHVLFQLGIFFALVQQWWESWGFANVSVIGFWDVLLLLFPAIVLFVLAHLLFPAVAAGANLEEHYYRQARFLWGLVFVATVESSFVAPLLRGDDVFEIDNLSSIPVAFFCIVLAFSQRRWLHASLAPLITFAVVLDTWLANPTLSAS